ncbi:nicotinate-nucleotide adenylyltransferase [Bacillus suaedaesalsae]|uniref:Probable nicotinate-nucleotide adenylyltransferase n=1 Tax=Bacillus suaedaesalsae TaxID=2810349 RepID=A0ABS2DL57_9BACI|nr:nicotinate-nucleotide adenylyltransferase [Bacillus suaedaesalsae]MBM6619225.1 nicotinate-nucleotide adenylyltransferase [Bacillus suaedaesalsae]
MKKIGILGGTFDPPHNGHLLIAHEVHKALTLDEVWFMPTKIPPHKEREVTGEKNRIAMLELALKNNEYFSIQPIELHREGKSYTYDTIRLLKEMYDHDFYFIIGADMVEYLPSWYNIDELIKLLTFVGVGRAGYSNETSYPLLHVSTPMFEVSSTLIRERTKQKGNTHMLVPYQVKQYIEENRLYE